MSAFVYLLHFADKLSHSQHYAGCTRSLRKRLESHARGHGSAICRELHKQGIPWQLAGLWVVIDSHQYRVERMLKDTHNMRRYCPLCNGCDTPPLRNATAYDIGNLGMVTGSELVAGRVEASTDVSVRFTGPNEPLSVGLWIRSLMQRDRGALGFIPAGGSEGLQYLIDRGKIAIASVNGEPVGYAAFTIKDWRLKERAEGKPVCPAVELDAAKVDTCKIQQVCVQDDARLLGIGRQLVSSIGILAEHRRVQCNVRNDLPANSFWQALGFEHVSTFKHPTSGSTLYHYQRKQATWQPTSNSPSDSTRSTTPESERSCATSPPSSPRKPDSSTDKAEATPS